MYLMTIRLDKGGAVLLDIETNGVVAIASKPDLNMAAQKTRQNYMLTPVYPGSVFKTVIAAAAIENGLDHPSKTFNCNLNLYGEAGEDKGKAQPGRQFCGKLQLHVYKSCRTGS